MEKPENFLHNLEDGLVMREGRDYATDKFLALESYLKITQGAMKKSKWSAINFIDLQAGPGKNRIGNNIYLGSPLIALQIDPPFAHYFFNELDTENFNALEKRVNQSRLASRIHLFKMDVNEAVDPIVKHIKSLGLNCK